jgi:hypothetical protein
VGLLRRPVPVCVTGDYRGRPLQRQQAARPPLAEPPRWPLPPRRRGPLALRSSPPLPLPQNPGPETRRPQDLDPGTHARAICALLDIPVYEDPIESLHLLFSLLLEFRSNPFLKQAAGVALAGGSEPGRRALSSASGWAPPLGGGGLLAGSGGSRGLPGLSRLVSTASSGSAGRGAGMAY